MMKASLMLVLLQWQHRVYALQSEQLKRTISRSIESDANRIDLNLCTDNVHANLGGLGGINVGDTGPEDKTSDGEWKKELRYKKVGTLPTGEKLDLVVTNLTEYKGNHPNQTALFGDEGGEPNARKGCVGNIGIHAPGEVELKFAVVYRGTDTPAPTKYSYDFTILDIDRSKYGMYEEITAHRFAAFFSPSIKPTGPTKVGELFTFAAAADAVEVPNPKHGFSLTAAQLNASVGLFFANVNHWKITAKAIDAPGGIGGLEIGRKILFSGRTALQDVGKYKKPDGKEPL